MGIFRLGPPTGLILKLKELFQIEDFIETGTYKGDTAAWASEHFSRVQTMDLSRELYDQAVRRHAQKKNIKFIFGDSRVELAKVVPLLEGPAIFWLDGHWSGGATYGENDECPLMRELELIHQSPHDHFLFIDDARLLVSPPPKPHLIEQWPTLSQVVSALNEKSHRPYVVIVEDVIISVPQKAQEFLADYCQDLNTKEWNDRITRDRWTDFQRALFFAKDAARALKRGALTVFK